MLGCHFTKEVAVKLQKGLRFRFLESHNLEEYKYILIYTFDYLNSVDVIEVE